MPDAPQPRGSLVDGEAEPRRESYFDRNIEVIVVAVMAITAILTAWTGFQSAKWGGVMSTSFSEAGAQRTESVRSSGIAGQQVAIDVAIFSSWVEAYAAEDELLAGFFRERFTDRLDAAATAWEALEPLMNDDAPESPFVMEEYVVDAAIEAADLEVAADLSAANARDANQRSDNYVIMSVLLATVLFFAALSSKLASRRNRRIMFGVATVGLVVCACIVATLPIEV